MRMLHTMLRVGDLDKSIQFYTEVMGMKLLRRNDNEEYRYTLAFVGYQEESEGTVLELTHNWDTSEYDLGTGYGHIALEVEDIYATCNVIENLKVPEESSTKSLIRQVGCAVTVRLKTGVSQVVEFTLSQKTMVTKSFPVKLFCAVN